MPRDIEDLLRESLAARAQDVTPDPETFSRVQRRIRRGRTWRLSAAGGVAVAAVALLAVVVPTLRSQRVEFAPAPPVASQPAGPSEEPGTAPTMEAGGLLFSDSDTVYSMALDGESAEPISRACHAGEECVTEQPLVTDVAAQPGSTQDALTGLVRTSQGCGRVGNISRKVSGNTSRQGITYFDAGGCAVSVGFAADGLTGGVLTEGDPDGFTLNTFDWEDPAPDGVDASFGIDLPATRMSIEDWVWTEVTGETARRGYLYLAADDAESFRVYRQPIERQEDGAISLPAGEPEPLPADGDWLAVAYSAQVLSGDETDGPPPAPAVYSIDAHWLDGAVDAGRVSRRVDDAVTTSVELPAELFAQGTFDIAEFWIDGLGNTIAYGNGTGDAWVTTWDGEGFTTPRKVAAEVVVADLLAQPQSPAQEHPSEPQPSDVEVYFADQDSACVSDVAVTREVDSPGVARGALNQLVAGPTPQEQNEGLTSPFSAETASALLDIRIDEGLAAVDLMHLGEWIDASPCTGDLVHSAIERTLLQFPTVERVRVTFDGSAQLYRDWKESGEPSPPNPANVAPPEQVVLTAEQIRTAAAGRDYDALRALIDPEKFTCTFGEEPADCVTVWQNQEEEGLDPLGVLAEILSQEPAQVEGAPIWTYPAAHASDPSYLGPRTGIDEDGVWRYYQQGGD